MPIDFDQFHALSPVEKLQLVEFLWDDLGGTAEEIPLPNWVVETAAQRRAEMLADPSLGLSHEEVWRRIRNRNA